MRVASSDPRWSWPGAFPVVVVALLSAAIAFVYAGDVVALARRWWGDDNYSHALLLLPLNMALIVLACDRLTVRRTPDWLAVIALAAVAMVMYVGSLAGIAIAFQAAAPLLLLTGLLAVYGRAALPTLWFVAGFLYFSLPIWDAINPLLQSLTTHAVERMIFATGLPAFINGNFVTVSAGVFEIAEGCSGLRFFMISTAIAALYAYLYLDGWRNASGFLLLAAVLAILGNWIRVYIIILVGVWLGIDHHFVTNHGFFGWCIFAVTMLILFGCSGRFRHRRGDPASSPAPTNHRWRVLFAPLLVLLAIIVLGRSFSGYAHSGAERELAAMPWPADRPERSAYCGRWQTAFVAADLIRRGVHGDGDAAVCVDVVFYPDQQQGRELINSNNRLFAGAESLLDVGKGHDSDVGVRWRLVDGYARGPVLVAYQYRIGGHVVDSARQAKLTQLTSMLARRTDAALVAAAVRCEDTCQRLLANGSLPERLRELPLFEANRPLTRLVDADDQELRRGEM